MFGAIGKGNASTSICELLTAHNSNFACILFLFMSAFGTTILSLQYRDQGAVLRVGGNYKGKRSRGGGVGGWI